MADYSFGGTDEENAELKKLNAEVVSLITLSPSLFGSRRYDMLTYHDSWRIQTASKIGRSLCALRKV